MAYNFKSIEQKWQDIWKQTGIYKTDINSNKEKAYLLVEFPYPSGAGLHVGHVRSYTAMDIVARKMRSEGKEVLYPMGWDAFGLPAENYAIKTGIHPSISTKENIENFRRQLQACGFSFDWDREVDTTDPNFYKWSQWIFLKLYENGLAYKKKMPVNWCPKDKCVLANEEVVDGCCERCGTSAEKRDKDQWMLAITKYAERLDKDLDDTAYLPKIKAQQRNWIGMSEGSEITFQIKTQGPSQTPSAFGTFPKGRNGIRDFVEVLPYNHNLIETASQNRKNMTQSEILFWNLVKNDSTGFDFTRQKVIGNFIIDFYCNELRLAIEIDGEYHNHNGHKERDTDRQMYLEGLGVKVLRYKNEEVGQLDLGFLIENFRQRKLELAASLREAPRSGEGVGEDLGGDELSFSVFTTRADTIFGCTYCVLAPEHALVDQLIADGTIKNGDEVIKYREEAKLKKDFDRSAEGKEKTGVRLDGVMAINPASGEELPLFIADYVLPNYGTGAIMAVPAHDERDFAFAKKYYIAMRTVINPVYIRSDVKEGEVLEKKNKIVSIVENTKGEILCVNWGSALGGKLFLGGTIEKGESEEVTALRELAEETGYCDAEVLSIGEETYSYSYYAMSKNKYFCADTRFVHIRLRSETKKENKLEEDEKGKFEIMWLTKQQAEKEVVEVLHARAYNLFIKNLPYQGDGVLFNSNAYNGMSSEEAREKITEAVGGKVVKKSKLRDWVFARQRYWGEPIPIVYDENNVMYPVAETEFPITLPMVDKFEPTDTGESPLALAPEWVYVYGRLDANGHFISCKKVDCEHLINKNNLENKNQIIENKKEEYSRGDLSCKKFRRETDTMPQWAGSSWYFMRYIDTHNDKAIGDRDLLAKWLPVDWYNGGMEHTTLHLLYSRFWYKFLYDIGVAPTSEPYYKRTSQGMILGAGGVKMSKTLGNVVNPDDIIREYGADVLRIYEMFMGPFDQAIAWDDKAIIGSKRFLDRVESFSIKVIENENSSKGKTSENKIINSADNTYNNKSYATLTNQTIKAVSEGIENMGFNTCISAMMIWLNQYEKIGIDMNNFKAFIKLLSPFAPHMTEEIWETLNKDLNKIETKNNFVSIHQEPWPVYDEAMMIEEEIVYALQINGKLRDTFVVHKDDTEEIVKGKAQATVAYEKYVGNTTPKKVIYVKGKLVNVVM